MLLSCQVVDRNSAKGPAGKAIPVDTDHSGLNKCPDQSSEQYRAILEGIKEMRKRPSLLERGDSHIRDSYTEEKLKIERLSEYPLPMSQCYINLAIVQRNIWGNQPDDEFGRPKLRSSLLERLNIEEPDQSLHITLPSLFEPRNIRDEKEERRPRRIFIRGHPGIGKTTLCKKIVHDFIYSQQWSEYFTRLLWVPLRNLQTCKERYKLTDLLHDEYFPQYKDPESIIGELYREIKKPDAGGSLFLLDGLDEIWKYQHSNNHIREIVRELLNQPNVIVTSRPSVQLLGGFEPFDIELETIGFHSEQVRQYIKQVTEENTELDDSGRAEKSREIVDFLDQHPLVGDLVRIPIQLDALCFAWDDVSTRGPQTMTELYQAIEIGLWGKDIGRLGIHMEKRLYPAEIEERIKDEATLLEKLAFAGLCKGLTVFDAKTVRGLSPYLSMPNSKSIDETLERISFLRSSGISLRNSSRRYYFLHLTLQEYFAARYLKRMWVDGKDLELPGATKEEICPHDFLRRYKYFENFDIVWRFMAGMLAFDTDHLNRYFKIIRSQPIDLLGATHHRLLMRCLFEIPPSHTELRESLEDQLLRWPVFEYRFLPDHIRYNGLLANEMEFPIGLLSKLLQEGKDKLIIHLLRSVHPRRMLSSGLAQLAVPWLESSPNNELVHVVLNCLKAIYVASSATGALENPPDLPETLLRAVGARLEASDFDFEESAMEVLEGQSSLPDTVLQTVAAKLKQIPGHLRDAATRILGKQSNLTETVLQAVAAELEFRDPDVWLRAIEVLEGRSNLPDTILRPIVANLVWNPNLMRILKKQAKLSEAILEALVAELENPEASVEEFGDPVSLPSDIGQILGAQSKLPKAILRALEAKLKTENPYVFVAAMVALQNQSKLTGTILQETLTKIEKADGDFNKLVCLELLQEPSPPEKVFQAIMSKFEAESFFLTRTNLTIRPVPANLPEAFLQMIALKVHNKKPKVQIAAISVLRTQSSLSQDILQELVAILGDGVLGVRLAVVSVLGKFLDRPAILREVASRLENEHPRVQRAVIDALRRNFSVPLLLPHQEPDIEAFLHKRELPDAVLQVMVLKLEDKESRVRDAATLILLSQSNRSEAILQAIALKLKNEDPHIRKAALCALQSSKLPEAIMQAVAFRLGDKDLDIWEVASKVLHRQEDLPGAIIQAVASKLTNRDPYIRKVALYVLRSLNLPEAIMQAVAFQLNDKDRTIREAALYALQSSKLPEAIMQAVAFQLVDNDRSIRDVASYVLQRQGDLPKAIMHVIALALQNRSPDVQKAALNSFREQRNLPKTITQAIVLKLENESYEVQEAALEVFQKQPDLPKAVLQVVASKMRDKNDHVRNAAIGILEEHLNLLDFALHSVASILEQWIPHQKYDSVESLILRHSPKLAAITSNSHDHLKGLVYFLLWQSFKRHLAWYQDNSKLHLVIDGRDFEYEGPNPCLTINELAPDRPYYGQNPMTNRGDHSITRCEYCENDHKHAARGKAGSRHGSLESR
ncbi:armadillo-type protein [Nemania abortiva]|nr:armadillo-type protein [Nemania abortiva]